MSQAALISASPIDAKGKSWTLHEWAASPSPPPQVYEWKNGGSKGVTTCDYGYDVPAAQKWAFSGGKIMQGETCLLAVDPPVLGACTSGDSKWDLGKVNETTAQIKTVAAEGKEQRCLKFIGGAEATGLFLDSCDVEAEICKQTRCASSTLLDELWYELQ